MEKVNQFFQIRISDQTKDEVTTAANRENVSVSRFVRSAVAMELKGIDLPTTPPPVKVKKDDILGVRFSKLDLTNIQAAAGMKDKSVSDFIRGAVEKKLEK